MTNFDNRVDEIREDLMTSGGDYDLDSLQLEVARESRDFQPSEVVNPSSGSEIFNRLAGGEHIGVNDYQASSGDQEIQAHMTAGTAIQEGFNLTNRDHSLVTSNPDGYYGPRTGMRVEVLNSQYGLDGGSEFGPETANALRGDILSRIIVLSSSAESLSEEDSRYLDDLNAYAQEYFPQDLEAISQYLDGQMEQPAEAVVSSAEEVILDPMPFDVSAISDPTDGVEAYSRLLSGEKIEVDDYRNALDMQELTAHKTIGTAVQEAYNLLIGDPSLRTENPDGLYGPRTGMRAEALNERYGLDGGTTFTPQTARAVRDDVLAQIDELEAIGDLTSDQETQLAALNSYRERYLGDVSIEVAEDAVVNHEIGEAHEPSPLELSGEQPVTAPRVTPDPPFTPSDDPMPALDATTFAEEEVVINNSQDQFIRSLGGQAVVDEVIALGLYEAQDTSGLQEELVHQAELGPEDPREVLAQRLSFEMSEILVEYSELQLLQNSEGSYYGVSGIDTMYTGNRDLAVVERDEGIINLVVNSFPEVLGAIGTTEEQIQSETPEPSQQTQVVDIEGFQSAFSNLLGDDPYFVVSRLDQAVESGIITINNISDDNRLDGSNPLPVGSAVITTYTGAFNEDLAISPTLVLGPGEFTSSYSGIDVNGEDAPVYILSDSRESYIILNEGYSWSDVFTNSGI